MTKKKPKKKTSKTDFSSDESDEEEIQEINQLKEKNLFLKQTVRTQTNQIGDLYHEINHLQQKEDENEKNTKVLDKLNRYVNKMRKNNRKVKTYW